MQEFQKEFFFFKKSPTTFVFKVNVRYLVNKIKALFNHNKKHLQNSLFPLIKRTNVQFYFNFLYFLLLLMYVKISKHLPLIPEFKLRLNSGKSFLK